MKLKNYFTPDEQKVLIFLLVFGFLGISLKFWGMKIEDKKTVNPDSIKVVVKKIIKVDIRTANEKLLTTVPGIGTKKAKQIIDYRNKHGFESLQDIMNIKGIGPKTYEKMKKYFVEFGNEKPKEKFATNKKSYKKDKNNKENIAKIDINKATYEQLLSIKGIGPKKAEDIINLRKELGGKFSDLEQLTKIRGIGKKTLQKLKKYLTVEGKNE